MCKREGRISKYAVWDYKPVEQFQLVGRPVVMDDRFSYTARLAEFTGLIPLVKLDIERSYAAVLSKPSCKGQIYHTYFSATSVFRYA